MKIHLPTNPSASFIARNPHLYAYTGAAATRLEAQQPVPDAPVACIGDRASVKLNKLETAYYNHLKPLHVWIGVQCITLKLGHDCRYSPDFWTVGGIGQLEAHEVKGKMFWDDAKVKLKVAATMYPMFDFYLVTRNDNGTWKYLRIPGPIEA
jgi:hypothetical protein